MKIIVTGATGFLGKYLVGDLLANDHQVVAIGRNLERLAELKAMGAEVLAMDLTDGEEVLELMPTADAVIHAAARSTVYGRWQDFYRDNVLASEHVLQACQKKAIKRLVFVSSPSIYTAKEDRFDIKEDEYDAGNKLNNYIRSKIAAEQRLHQLKADTELVIVRPRGLFGVGDTSIFPRLLRANGTIGIPLFKRKEPTIVDVTCVENVAYSLRLCCETAGIDGEVFNITNGEPMYFKQIIERIFAQLGDEVNFRSMNIRLMYGLAAILERTYQLFRIKNEPALTRYTVCTLAYSQTLNIQNAVEKLGYQPQKTMAQGIDDYARHLIQEGFK